MKQPVQIFKCPCEGKRFIRAGEPNPIPTKAEKIEYGDYIAMGCTVLTIPIKQYREERWTYCGRDHSK